MNALITSTQQIEEAVANAMRNARMENDPAEAARLRKLAVELVELQAADLAAAWEEGARSLREDAMNLYERRSLQQAMQSLGYQRRNVENLLAEIVAKPVQRTCYCGRKHFQSHIPDGANEPVCPKCEAELDEHLAAQQAQEIAAERANELALSGAYWGDDPSLSPAQAAAEAAALDRYEAEMAAAGDVHPDVYWGDEFGRYEAAAEAAAFMADRF